jgi:serine/threonine protein phosphatase PrpC
MIHWNSFGASVIGPGHIAVGKPNQDAWLAFQHERGDGIVVSDGLGSKSLSDFGSRAACLAVARAVNGCLDNELGDYESLFESIKTKWLSLIVPLEPDTCAATCLFAFRRGNGEIWLGMLGDGLAAAIKTDGSVVALFDDKSESFSNVTTALSSELSSKEWQVLSLPEEECVAVLLCTDGVADDLDNVDGFVKGCIESHRNLAAVTANRHLREMLANWPTPKHSDDKTIACLCRQEVADE